MASFVEQLQRIVRNYREDGQPWPASSRAIAAWDISQNLWQPQRGALINQCAEQLSRALREEYTTDAQGRRARTKHSARVEKDGEQQGLGGAAGFSSLRIAPSPSCLSRFPCALASLLRRHFLCPCGTAFLST